MKDEIPKHLALIPDGNRRWASREGLPTIKGHQQGFETFIDFCKWCRKAGIKELTAYGFSTENWNRPQDQVENLMELFEQGLREKIIEGDEEEFENVKIKVVGNKKELPESLKNTMARVEDLTKDNEELKLNLAINYGGRWEIKQVLEELVKEVNKGNKKIEDLDLKNKLRVKSYPELIIRTGGERRLSNFLTWQSAYSELFFSDKLWPDFSEEDFEKVLKDYAKRKRRFGE